MLCYCLDVWYSKTTTENRQAVQRVINTGCPLPPLEAITRFPVSGKPGQSQVTPCTPPTTCMTHCPVVCIYSSWLYIFLRFVIYSCCLIIYILFLHGWKHPKFHCTCTLTIKGYSVLWNIVKAVISCNFICDFSRNCSISKPQWLQSFSCWLLFCSLIFNGPHHWCSFGATFGQDGRVWSYKLTVATDCSTDLDCRARRVI